MQIKNLSAYEALAVDLGLNSVTPLKLISQALLSLFIALMAPSGAIILNGLYGENKKNSKAKKDKPKIDKLLLYTNSRFRNEEKPSTLKGRPEVLKETGLTPTDYAVYDGLAKRLQLIKTSGNMTTANVTRAEFLFMIRRNQPFKRTLTAVK